ncbi:hypothetical protein TRIATDRAFT_33139 [Trichoderma atroviride IMI 206040]|uniref:Uncharacterized protein n=1 Tax=Hypocrea atroviridis (strain ATCC 20476 / IMI 206040) TaxID=452589 RepID=G9P2Y4_HYPAI|nr:uncharacterized protein TRIATDRAFT_33139 [Trichoderma atroviride IMI 206040]EHK42758.1 hypothetical protein TRIATDRAFT_33139 [Trichoderma atroviride IMI 206040]
MGRRPPVAKFSLAVRKNIRDEWENRKPDYEDRISAVLGAPWKIDIDLRQVCAYAEDGYAAEAPGSMISGYIDGVLYQLDRFITKHGDKGKEELNTIAAARTITMDLDEGQKFSYCGCAVSGTGSLVILFREGYLGTNIDDACSLDNLENALNAAPSTASARHQPMSFIARAAIRSDWDAQTDAIKRQLGEILGRDIALEPRFEQAFDRLSAAAGDGDASWQRHLGAYHRMYYESLASYLVHQKFGEDDMLREAFHEGIDKATVVFRIVGREQLKRSAYNECVIEDGTLILQTTAEYYGTNIAEVANTLMEQL